MVVHRASYPGFDDELAAAMRLETIHFFAEVLRGDLSIFAFLDSDFTCVNDRLAAHYGNDAVVRRVQDVYQQDFVLLGYSAQPPR